MSLSGKAKVVFAFAIALSMACEAQTKARRAADPQQPAALMAVHATGSKRYTEAEIAAATGLKTGAIVRPQDFRSAADELVASGAFDEVRYRYEPAATGYVVTYELTDNQEFLPVSYDNFVWYTDQQLTDALHQRFPLFKGEVSANEGMIEKVTDALNGLLTERGIAGTARFQQQGGQGTGEGKINGGVFIIDGLKVTVKEVNFPGAAAGDVPELKKAAEVLLSTGYQRSLAAVFAEKNLRQVYAKQGYLKPTFSAPEVKLVKDDPQAPEVAVSIPVQSGARYTVEKIRWWGNKAFEPQDLQKQLSIKPGTVADGIQIESDLTNIEKLYASKGYLRARAAANPSYDDPAGMVSYEFAVQEGDIYRLHEVEISGAGLSKDMLARLREAWQMREGEPYNAAYETDYVKATRSLLAPNVSVQMNKDISDENKTVDVNIDFVVHTDKVTHDPK